MASEKITLAGGCFWCTEAALAQLDGVIQIQPGYMGGDDPAPAYEAVCSGESGHAEVVEIHFDPAKIDFRTLLTAFFCIHDPTTVDRQGNDIGSQYRSAIFYDTTEQGEIAEQLICELDAAAHWPRPIVTEVTPASRFFVAEPYHHQYFRRNPYQGYCQAVTAPKMMKIRALFAGRLKADD